jgi:CDP-diacylglycerol--serine O-phosphatidyltransferase
MIIFYLLNATINPYTPELFSFSTPVSILFLIVPAAMPVFAALRLAKFNLDDTQATSFRGLPTPANAIAVVTFILGAHYSGSGLLNAFLASSSALIILSLSLSLLMVTNIPLLSLKFKSLSFKGNEGRFIIVIICVVLLAGLGFVSLPGIIPVYIIVSLLSLLF